MLDHKPNRITLKYFEFERNMPYLQEATLKFDNALTIPEREFWRSVVLGMRLLCKEKYKGQNA